MDSPGHRTAAGLDDQAAGAAPPSELLVEQSAEERGILVTDRPAYLVDRGIGLFEAPLGKLDAQPLHNLVPVEHREQLPYLRQNPFAGWWSKLPTTPLNLWPFVALYFTEHDIPLPDFTAPFTRLDDARATRESTRRAAEQCQSYWGILIKRYSGSPHSGNSGKGKPAAGASASGPASRQTQMSPACSAAAKRWIRAFAGMFVPWLAGIRVQTPDGS